MASGTQRLAPRAGDGVRRYGGQDLRRLRFVRHAQATARVAVLDV